jgi:acetyl-CoA C-acetyltransferase
VIFAIGFKPKALALAALITTSAAAPSLIDEALAAVTEPVPSVTKAGRKPTDFDLHEINEAFSSAACALTKVLELDAEKVNVNGGAVAIGHPIGASGARVLVTLLFAMQQRGKRTGMASLCLGGGNAVSLAVEAC